MITEALPAGDYSLPGFEDRVAIERKSVDNLIGCLMNSDRSRFERELQRASHYDLFAVVVESTLHGVSRVSPPLQEAIAANDLPQSCH